MPAIISTTPTMCMNVVALTGMTRVTTGLKYMLQSVRILKNLSAPAMIGPRPSPIRSAHQVVSNRLSNSFISPPTQKSAEAPTGYSPLVTAENWLHGEP